MFSGEGLKPLAFTGREAAVGAGCLNFMNYPGLAGVGTGKTPNSMGAGDEAKTVPVP